MAIAVEMYFAGGTLDQYEEVLKRMDFGHDSPGHPDGLFHWSAAVEGGLKVVDVWKSREAFEKFGAEMLGPITAEVGVAQPEMTFYEVHNTLYSPDFAPAHA